RTGARPQPGAVRTISTAVLDGTPFFSDPTFWSTFSPARFGPAVRPFIIAVVFTAIAVLPVRWLAFRLGAVAEPGERRIHSRPTARLGGLAMYLGFGLSAALFSINPSTLGLLLSAAVITTLMVFDDLRGVRALSKLIFQVAASLLAIVVFGIYIHSVNLPGGHVVNLAVAVSIPLTLLSVAKGAVVLALVVPVAALAIPIFDTGWAILRRRMGGRSIATPDTEHLHHRLLDFGLSPQETALVFYFGTAIFAALGLAIYGHKKVLLGAILLMLLGIVIIMMRRFRRTSRG